MMTIEDGFKKANEIMWNAATFYAKDKGATAWTAELHSTAAGLALRAVFQPKEGQGLEASATNYGKLFHALYNHSAWRQKFEKGTDERPALFKKKEERGATSLMQELEEEMGE